MQTLSFETNYNYLFLHIETPNKLSIRAQRVNEKEFALCATIVHRAYIAMRISTILPHYTMFSRADAMIINYTVLIFICQFIQCHVAGAHRACVVPVSFCTYTLSHTHSSEMSEFEKLSLFADTIHIRFSVVACVCKALFLFLSFSVLYVPPPPLFACKCCFASHLSIFNARHIDHSQIYKHPLIVFGIKKKRLLTPKYTKFHMLQHTMHFYQCRRLAK